VILRYEPGQGYVGASPCFPQAYDEDGFLDQLQQSVAAGRFYMPE
jgi:hypothetical protein